MNSKRLSPDFDPEDAKLPPRSFSGLKAQVAGVLSLVLLASRLLGGQPADPGEFVNLEKLSDRVTLAYWVGVDRRCNLTAIRTEKGLVIIDTEMSPRVMAPIKEKLENAFGRNDWIYVINTHAHDNHAGGNSLFKGAVIAGHQNLADDMQWIIQRQTDAKSRNSQIEHTEQYVKTLRSGLPQAAARGAVEARMVRGEIRFLELHTEDLRGGYEVIRPSLTFSNTHALNLGDVQLELVFFGKGHSSSDILIYCPQEKLLVTGAIFYQKAHFPEIGEASTMQDVQRFLTVLDRFVSKEVRVDKVVPSHSPPLQKSDLAPVRDYYRRMLAGLTAARREGLTFDQAKLRLPAAAFPAFKDRPPGVWSHGMHERNLRNLWRIVQEKG